MTIWRLFPLTPDLDRDTLLCPLIIKQFSNVAESKYHYINNYDT